MGVRHERCSGRDAQNGLAYRERSRLLARRESHDILRARDDGDGNTHDRWV